MSKCDTVKKTLREKIYNGELKPESRLPIEPKLAKDFKVGRNTIREAVSSLVHEGLLKKIQGKGTYVTSVSDNSYSRRSWQIGLACYLRSESLETFNFIQDYTLEKGGLLTVYNVNEDQQAPEKEKIFLEKAERENFAGVIALPSPIEPLNTEIYARMRSKGCKVALIAPYKDDMSNEVSFLYDYYHAGYMAAAKMKVAGYENISMARIALPISYQQMKKGIAQAAEDFGLNLLDDITKEQKPDIFTLPPKTGIISTQTSMGHNVFDWISESGLTPGKDIGLCSRQDYLVEGRPAITCLKAPEKEQFKAAIDYILDDNIPATQIIHKTFKFIYEEHGTVENI